MKLVIIKAGIKEIIIFHQNLVQLEKIVKILMTTG